MTAKFLVLLWISFILVGCGNKADKSKEILVPTDTIKSDTKGKEDIKTIEAKLHCKPSGVDSLGVSHFDVVLALGGKETKIKSTKACGRVTPSEFKSYGIPEDAISACGGRHAELGNYFYIIWRDGNCVVFEGLQNKGQAKYRWKEVAVK